MDQKSGQENMARGVATCTHGRTCVLKKSKNAAKRKKKVIIE